MEVMLGDILDHLIKNLLQNIHGGKNGGFRHQESIFHLAHASSNLHRGTRAQSQAAIGDFADKVHRTGGGIHLAIHGFDDTFFAIKRAVFENDLELSERRIHILTGFVEVNDNMITVCAEV